MKVAKKHYRALIWLLIFNVALISGCTKVISSIQYKQMFRKVDLIPDTIKITKIEKVNDTLNFELCITIPPKFLPYHGIITFRPELYNSDLAFRLKTITRAGQHVEDDGLMVFYKNGAKARYGASISYKECVGKDFKINSFVDQVNGKVSWNYLKVIHVENFRQYCDTIK